jgi:2'-5' RNA ligase
MKRRLFIAINLPEEVKRQLSPLILALAKLNRRVVIKWVKSELIHLTFHFLGYLDQIREEKILEIIAKISQNYHQINIKLGGLGAFPNLTSPRVIFLECHEIDGNVMTSLQKEIGKELEQIGFEPERRRWQSHLTLGRVKGGGKVNLAVKEIPQATFEIKSVELMESRLSQAGPEYIVVKSFPLKP